jgi:hypothetical protein
MNRFQEFRRSPYYRFFLWIVVLACFFLLIRLNSILSHPTYIPADDFVRYWAAGRLMAQGGNPYDPAQIQVLQDITTGLDTSPTVPTPAYVPPWSLPIFTLFGILNYPTSRLLFLLVNVCIFFICAELAWKLYQSFTVKKYWSWIVCFTLGATISTLEKGQISAILLLGVVSFLHFHENGKRWLAGASLVLVSWKPQLFYLLWPAFGLWVIQYRKWSYLLGLLGFTATGAIIAVGINPDVFPQFIDAVLHLPPFMFATPSIGAHLRYFIFGIEANWPNYIPMGLGLSWFGVEWYRFRKQWGWKDRISVLLFISLITAPYIWTYDMALFVLPSIQAIIWILIKKPSRGQRLLLLIYFIINLLDLILHRYTNDFWFIWYAPSLFLWFLLVKKSFQPLILIKEDGK